MSVTDIRMCAAWVQIIGCAFCPNGRYEELLRESTRTPFIGRMDVSENGEACLDLIIALPGKRKGSLARVVREAAVTLGATDVFYQDYSADAGTWMGVTLDNFLKQGSMESFFGDSVDSLRRLGSPADEDGA